MAIDGISNLSSVRNTMRGMELNNFDISHQQKTNVESGAVSVSTVDKQNLHEKALEQVKNAAIKEKNDPNLFQGQSVSPEKIKSAVNDINNRIKATTTECLFSYHEETNRISITVRDASTKEVIREIPPEKTLDMLAKAWELAGILVDEKR